MAHRETQLRIHGRDFTVRTEMGVRIRTVKQLEAAHYRAVREAIIQARIAQTAPAYAESEPGADKEASERRRWCEFWQHGKQGPMPKEEAEKYEAAIRARMAERHAAWVKHGEDLARRAQPTPVKYSGHTRLRAPNPPVRYTYPNVPASVREYIAKEGE